MPAQRFEAQPISLLQPSAAIERKQIGRGVRKMEFQ
jgi:hypothetical protein